MVAKVQPHTKVLRIGIIQDGKIVQEKRIRPGGNVTIGSSHKATFNYSLKRIPKKFPLFSAKGQKHYSLCFLDAMSGKIACRDGVHNLEQLRKRGEATRRGDVWMLPLSERDRGKITIDNLTVLFQFVPAPPEPLHPVTRTDFKPKLLDEDDPVFVGFLGLFTLLGAIFLIYTMNVEAQELVTFDTIPDRFVQLVIEQPKNDAQEEDLADIEQDALDAEKKRIAKEKEEEAQGQEQAKEKKEQKPKTAEELAAEEAARRQEMEKQVIENSLLLKMIGTRGESSSGQLTEDLFAEDDGVVKDLDRALAGVSGVEVGSSDAMAIKGGSGEGTGREDASIGDLARADGGSAKVGSGPSTNVKGKVVSGTVDAFGGDPGKVKAAVGRYYGHIRSCYELQLKSNPSLSGRVEVSWTIAGGRATSVALEGNTTGDDALGQCIVRKVRSWKFPEELEMDVVFPFILAPG